MNGWKTRLAAPLFAGVLLGLLLAAAWPSISPPALAQLPDSGAQRVRMIGELQGVNAKLDAVIKLLTQIKDQKAPAGGATRARPARP